MYLFHLYLFSLLFFLGSLVFVPSECLTDLHLIQFYIPSLFEPCFNRFSRLTVPVLVLVPLMFIIVELCCALLSFAVHYFSFLFTLQSQKSVFSLQKKSIPFISQNQSFRRDLGSEPPSPFH